MKLKKVSRLKGEVTIPGDKSISHRSIMFGSIADGVTEIRHFLKGADCLSTISCFRQMGISIEEKQDVILVHGKGLRGLKPPASVLDCGNSGTTTRLISGILAAQDFTVTLTGDASIQRRPMNRIIDPLSRMGARIASYEDSGCAPLTITGSPLSGIHYISPVASAQVKSAILLAGLYAGGTTSVTEPYVSRNHTELMLRSFGAELVTEGTRASVRPCLGLTGSRITVPGDISSAAYFLAAGLLVPNSELLLKQVGINPTRDGILHVLRDMGGDISILNCREEAGEPVADLLVKSSSLKGTIVEKSIIPTLIDEIPVIAALACFAEGETVIRDAAELKVKESNRIAVMVKNLTAMGADVTETADGMVIRGGKPLCGAVVDSYLDHRIAMTFAVAALGAEGETEILGSECIDISYPGFFEDLRRLESTQR